MTTTSRRPSIRCHMVSEQEKVYTGWFHYHIIKIKLTKKYIRARYSLYELKKKYIEEEYMIIS